MTAPISKTNGKTKTAQTAPDPKIESKPTFRPHKDENLVVLIGRLAGEVETRYTPSGTLVAVFSLANNNAWTDARTGELKGSTMFVRCEFYGKLAETVRDYLSTGRRILVEGRLDIQRVEKDGDTNWYTKIIGSSFQFLDSKKAEAPADPDELDF